MPRANELVGIQEIAKHWNVTKQRAFTLSNARDFPRPIAKLAQGRIWRASEVQRWSVNRGRTW